MFDKILKFFLNNSRVNYTLFFLIFAVGIYSYVKTPKEIFPRFDLDMISISGHYAGASATILNKMAVSDIEDEVSGISGIEDMSTTISPGKFTIVLELEKSINKYNISSKVKDAIDTIKGNFPSDMDDPIVKVVELDKSLLEIAISSNIVPLHTLKDIAANLESKLQKISNISDVTIYGSSDEIYEIIINEQKIDALELDKNNVYNAISKISFIFPLGKIESNEGHFFLSTNNGAKTKDELAQTILKIGSNTVYLRDFATVKKYYEDSTTLFSVDNKNALNLVVKQSETGSAIQIANTIEKLLKKQKEIYPDITYQILNDQSQKIKDRLNIVISNILLGIILITLLVWWLINARMALIIALGIPTSFVVSAIYFYLSGYTVNMISLVGVLLALGIVVDDAIVVSENIQQKLEEGLPPKKAAYIGAKQMAKPVTIASLTTLFSFIPALMISGTLGEVIKLIPIALSALVIASLVESFLFLPIHAAHTLNNNSKVKSWDKVNKIYSKVIHKLMNNRKLFLVSFMIIIPLLMISIMKISKFQMFAPFDASVVNIAIKTNVNTKVEDAFKIVKQIEKDLIVHKKEFYIKHISSVAGFRLDSASNTEVYPYVMQLTIELEKLKASNFIDKFITPYLSFYYDNKGRIRKDTSQTISNKIKQFLEVNKYKNKYNLIDLSIVQKKVGPIKSDIKIGLIGNDTKLIYDSILQIQNGIKKLNGIISISNTATFGADEIKIKLNKYGQRLGFSEASIGSLLTNMYLGIKKSTAFDNTNMIDIRIKRENLDNFSMLENLNIATQDGTFVSIKDIATLHKVKSFERITKDAGETNFYIFANVDSKIITATEVIEAINPILENIKLKDIRLKLKGENEKKKELAKDILIAAFFAMVLIMISMLYLFNSFKDTFIVMSVIPFSFLGVLIGHLIMGLNLSMPSFIGGLGLAGVVINDGIIMMTQLKTSRSLEDVYILASKRFRPIILTSITTLIGLSSLIFFPTGQAAIFQPMAIALGFGLAWGTILNLLYLPVLYSFANKIK